MSKISVLVYASGRQTATRRETVTNSYNRVSTRVLSDPVYLRRCCSCFSSIEARAFVCVRQNKDECW